MMFFVPVQEKDAQDIVHKYTPPTYQKPEVEYKSRHNDLIYQPEMMVPRINYVNQRSLMHNYEKAKQSVYQRIQMD